MKGLNCVFFLSASLVLFPFFSFSQYKLNGNAVQESCNCYLLTNDEQWQSGSVWQVDKISLDNPFDFKFNVFLGYKDAEGADGIVFMLQPISTSLGAAGGGMGFEGVSPSIGIALDTWQNTENNDPAYDHISIQKNGVITHGNDLAGPIPASASSDNIEDGKWHVLQIKWDPATKTLSTYFDGVFRLSTQTDLVAGVFNNDPMVYWGFASATGGKNNLQKFCTALNPVFTSGSGNDEVCIGSPVAFKDSSTSFTTIKSYFWDFGDGSTSTLQNPPPHLYPDTGIYKVSHYITALDNCQSEPFIRTIKVGDHPDISFEVFDTCQGINPRIDVDTKLGIGTISQWNWEVNNAPFSENAKPDLSQLSPGDYSLSLSAKSSAGCLSNNYVTGFSIYSLPEISLQASDGCVNTAINFAGSQSDNFSPVQKWKWDYGDGNFSEGENSNHSFVNEGNYTVKLYGTALNGCEAFQHKTLTISAVHAIAKQDTLVLINSPFTLSATGGTTYSWFPMTGLDNPFSADPTGTGTFDQKYTVTVRNDEGCSDTASVSVRIFKGSSIFVPTAFTPNGDGLNDVIKPYFTGIKSLSYFTIYNSWGQKVFSTSDMNNGWDGYSKNGAKIQGVYVWVLEATDEIGKIYKLKGTFSLIR